MSVIVFVTDGLTALSGIAITGADAAKVDKTSVKDWVGDAMQSSRTHNRPDENLREESKTSGWNHFFSNQQSIPPDEFVNPDELTGSLPVEHDRQNNAYKHQGPPKPPIDGRLEDAAPARANPAEK